MKKERKIFETDNKKSMTIRPSRYRIVLVVLLLLLAACGEKEVKTISDLAYDYNPDAGYVVYIKESGAYVPYLVLTNDYDGQTMLFRYYVMDKARSFARVEGIHPSYYPNSLMDQYLSNDVYNSYSEKTREYIQEVSIEISDKESIGIANNNKETIQRKVFLIGAYELGFPEMTTSPNEGKPLKYFMEDNMRVEGVNEKGTNVYWLRTASTWHHNTVCYISGEYLGETDVSYELGVRPVICLKPDTPVFQKELDGAGTVYVIE